MPAALVGAPRARVGALGSSALHGQLSENGARGIVSRNDKRATHDDRDDAVVVHLPQAPPTLTPAAARALLRLLLRAHQRAGRGGEHSAENHHRARPTGEAEVPQVDTDDGAHQRKAA